jgi:hypothetical protein
MSQFIYIYIHIHIYVHIHIYGNVTRKLTVSLNKQKCHFSFTKLLQEGRTCPPWGVGTSGKWEEWGKDVGG